MTSLGRHGYCRPRTLAQASRLRLVQQRDGLPCQPLELLSVNGGDRGFHKQHDHVPTTGQEHVTSRPTARQKEGCRLVAIAREGHGSEVHASVTNAPSPGVATGAQRVVGGDVDPLAAVQLINGERQVALVLKGDLGGRAAASNPSTIPMQSLVLSFWLGVTAQPAGTLFTMSRSPLNLSRAAATLGGAIRAAMATQTTETLRTALIGAPPKQKCWSGL